MEQSDLTLKQQLATSLGDLARPYITPLLFEQAGQVLVGGTASFVDTGTSRLLVTAAHNITKFDSMIESGDEVSMIVGGPNPSQTVEIKRDWLIGHDPSLCVDVATFGLPNCPTASKEFFRADGWPPPRVKAGELVVIVGSAMCQLKQTASAVRASLNVVSVLVSSVSNRTFDLFDTEERRAVVQLDPTLEKAGFSGMSGSAAFRFDGPSMRLAGFLAASQDSPRGLIRCVHADLIHADGTLQQD